MDELDEHIKLYKKMCKRGLHILESIQKAAGTTKRGREDEDEDVEEKGDGASAPTTEKPTVTAKEELFFCEGRVWETPVVPCQNGPKSYIKDGIRYHTPGEKKSKLYVVCRECKNARDRENREKKKNKIAESKE
jgi:hypothetical protein